jgi:general secretion pathway protein A
MYTQFFGLKEKPFAITPDPRYLFMSERHAEALAHLMYGINEAGGFVQLTGEIGAGKTTLVRAMLEQMPKHAEVAVILNPRVTPHELLLSICQEIGVAVEEKATESSKALVDSLNRHLLAAHAQGRRVVVIVDEAQNLSVDTLEQVRLLTNLETASTKLLQIILIGQPELREVLASSGLKQLAQRITGRYHLEPLSKIETQAYVKHRLRIAGATGEIFSDRALKEVYRVSRGVPRVINVVCDRALLGAYSEDRHRIDAVFVRRAASEVFGHPLAPGWMPWAGGATAAIAVGVLIVAGSRFFGDDSVATAAVSSAPSAPIQQTSMLSPPAVPALTDAKILLAQQSTSGTDQSFAALLALWGAKLDGGAERPCDQAAKQGLECVYQKGSWGQLRMLNRPAILTLTDDAGVNHRAVLVKLGDESADIDFGNGARAVTLGSLSRYWLGDYLVVWRPQALGQSLGQRALTFGMQGSEIRSLRKSLEALRGGDIAKRTEAEDFFDEELTRYVETFQREHRLTVDGIAGVQTQIVLDSIVNSANTPHLLEGSDDKVRGTAESGGKSS